jgi:glycerol-3-phosphate cytidylyltransferase-like family protein
VESKKYGEILVVIVNNDEQVKKKGSVPFMSEEDRLEIVSNIKGVDSVILSVDTDTTVRKTLEIVSPDVFTKGGDRVEGTIPELEVCERLGIEIIYGVGGGKIRASSELIKNASDFIKTREQ